MRGSNKDVSENEKLFLELTENEKRDNHTASFPNAYTRLADMPYL